MRRTVVALLWLAASAWAATELAEKSHAAEKVSAVAILEPEVAGDLSKDERQNLVASVDALLFESLSKQKGLQLVERAALDKILEEQQLQRAAGEVPQPLRPLWTAGVMICTRIETRSGTVMLEAVSAQTGQLIAGLYLKVPPGEEPAKALAAKAPGFAAGLPEAIERAADKQLLEISGKLSGKLNRLSWMLDDFAEAAGAKVSTQDKIGWLVPRQPLVTKEERLLRVMGLAEAKPADAIAGLSPVPQMRLQFEVVDSAKVGVTFENTPLSLKLSLRLRDGTAVETAIEGTVGHWEECRSKGVSWLMEQLRDSSAKAANTDDDTLAAKLAKEELAAVAQWAGLSQYDREQAGTAIRARIARHALRAAHLDPRNEEAAYLVVSCVDALYPREGKDESEMSLEAIDRIMIETQRYLDRFPRSNVPHRFAVLSMRGTAGLQGSLKYLQIRDRDAILRPPETRAYPYMSAMVRVWAEVGYLSTVDKRAPHSNAIAAFGFNLRGRLIPCIPADKLDEEYAYWREFYATRIAEVMRKTNPRDFNNTRPVPWELIDAAFQARKKNPQAVRDDLQALARQFPRSEKAVWGGDEYRPSEVRQLLEAAGDKEWRSWEPDYKAAERARVTIAEMSSLLRRLSPTSSPVWDPASLLTIKGVDLKIPEAVRAAGVQPRSSMSGTIQAMMVAGGDLWIRTPAELPGNAGTPYRLLAVPLNDKGETTDKATLIKWPETNKLEGEPWFKIHYVTREASGDTVWIGTRAHGLARFEKKDGSWQGRWYNDISGYAFQRRESHHHVHE
jgi:hypothetical protein